MKIIFFNMTLIMLIFLSCNSKHKGFRINANVDGISNGTVFYVKNWKNNQIIDSALVINGKFTLYGVLTTIENLFLYATDSKTKEFIYTNLIIENENVTLNAHKQDFPWNLNITGSTHQDVAEKFNHIEFQKQEIKKKLEEIFKNSPRKNKGELELSNKIKSVSDSLENVKIELIKDNFSSYAAMINFKYYKNSIPLDELELLYTNLKLELKQSKYGKAIKMQLDYPPVNIGDSYYNYTAINQDGDTISLSEIEKYILLHFSSAACYYSQKSIPELRKLYARYRDKLEIVKISQDMDKNIWSKSIERDSITWTNLWDGKGEYSESVIKYGTIGAPNFILISPDKIILDKWFGYKEGIIEDKIKIFLLNEK